MSSQPPRLILASTSRYRRELLERLRLPFTVVAPEVDETALPGEAPADLAMRLAIAKARAVATREPDAVVIGSDQVALCDGAVLGKPGNFERAAEQLRLMSAREVVFHSALAVVHGEHVIADDVITRCQVRELDEAGIAAYLHADTPYDTAGSAKAEALGIALMESISSTDPTALIGLPLISLTRMLRRVGLDPLRATQGQGR